MNARLSGQARVTSLHEMQHLIAGACAIEYLAPESYKDARATWYVRGAAGSASIEIGDVVDDPEALHLSKRIAGFVALGPCCKLPAAQVVDYIKDGRWIDLGNAASLSDPDMELVSTITGPLTQSALVVMATQKLMDRLCLSGQLALAKTLWTASNKGLANDWPLTQVIPQKEARKAVRAAQADLDDILAPTVDAETWDRMTVKERLGRRVAKGAST